MPVLSLARIPSPLKQPLQGFNSCCWVRHAGACSGAVSALISIITPLPYTADFRPYFTIHDSIFAQLSSQELPSNANSLPRLLGVTNLYFLKVSDVSCAKSLAQCLHSARSRTLLEGAICTRCYWVSKVISALTRMIWTGKHTKCKALRGTCLMRSCIRSR